MGKSGGECRQLATKALHGNWILTIAFFVCMFFVFVGSIFSVIGVFLCVGPLTAGLALFYTNLARGRRATIGDMFTPFARTGANFLLCFLQGFYMFWWSFLPIVPIVKCFSYALAYHILNDNPTMSANDAITTSRKMMLGHKGKLFWMTVWFWVCSVFSLGIGLIWLVPHYQMSIAVLYADLAPAPAPKYSVTSQLAPRAPQYQPPRAAQPAPQQYNPTPKPAPTPMHAPAPTPILEDNIYTGNDDL